MSHSLTVSISQVYSNDEFDLLLVYSGERLRSLWPSCFLLLFFFLLLLFFSLSLFFLIPSPEKGWTIQDSVG